MTDVLGVFFGDAMGATVTTLQREIAREERLVGLRSDRPLTDAAIVRRRVEIAVLLGLVGLVALGAIFAATGTVRIGATVLALGFGAYAIEKERHLQRLARLRDGARCITLVVADGLVVSGALRDDRELLALRVAVERAAVRLAAELADLLPTDCARVRLAGPSGELPIAAEHALAPGRFTPDDATSARHAVRLRQPARRPGDDDRTVLTVLLCRHDDVVGVLEVVSGPGDVYLPRDVALMDGFGRGAVAALLGMS